MWIIMGSYCGDVQYKQGTKEKERAVQLTYGKMAFPDFPLTLDACTFDCACTMDILEDVVFLNFIKPKKYSNAMCEEHDLSSIIV